MENKSSTRILWPDILKTFAVFLVILGHISSTYDSREYFSPVALWIYSFHMPLFMMLSGMFFKYSLKKDFKTLLIDKSRLLLLPLLCWGMMNFIIEALLFVNINDWGGGNYWVYKKRRTFTRILVFKMLVCISDSELAISYTD